MAEPYLAAETLRMARDVQLVHPSVSELERLLVSVTHMPLERVDSRTLASLVVTHKVVSGHLGRHLDHMGGAL